MLNSKLIVVSLAAGVMVSALCLSSVHAAEGKVTTGQDSLATSKKGEHVKRAEKSTETDRPPTLVKTLDDYEASISKYCVFDSTEPISLEFDVYGVKEQRRYKCDNGDKIIITDGKRLYQEENTVSLRSGLELTNLDGPGTIALGIVSAYLTGTNKKRMPATEGVKRARFLGIQAISEPGKKSDDTIWGLSFLVWVDAGDGDTAHIVVLHPMNLKKIKIKKVRGK